MTMPCKEKIDYACGGFQTESAKGEAYSCKTYNINSFVFNSDCFA